MAAKVTKETTKSAKFAEGGNTHMFGEQEAGKVPSGETGKPDQRGPGDKFAKGGSNKMFGYSPSLPARAGCTSAR